MFKSISSILLATICIASLSNCNSNSKGRTENIDSLENQKKIDAQMAKGDQPDDEQEGPTFEEVKRDLLSSYNKTEIIDTSLIDGKDSLHVYSKYYCLHDSSLTVPKRYIWGGDKPKDFIANTFANKIVVVNNKDTVFNRVIKKDDFLSVINDEEKKYATLFGPHFHGFNKTTKELTFSYSVSIPLTDVGVPACLVIDKKGKYRVVDEYAKID